MKNVAKLNHPNHRPSLYDRLTGSFGTVLQLRQDVALLRDQMSNLVVSKEFAAFKAAVCIPKGIAEQHDEQYEKRLEQIEKSWMN